MSSPDVRFCGLCGSDLAGYTSCPKCTLTAKSVKPDGFSSRTQWILAAILGVVFFVYFVTSGRDSPPTRTAEQLREHEISRHFSVWNGSHTALTELVRSSMHDPRSFEHVSTYYNDHGDTLFIEMTYRGSNAFGATITDRVYANVSASGGHVIEVVATP